MLSLKEWFEKRTLRDHEKYSNLLKTYIWSKRWFEFRTVRGAKSRTFAGFFYFEKYRFFTLENGIFRYDNDSFVSLLYFDKKLKMQKIVFGKIFITFENQL